MLDRRSRQVGVQMIETALTKMAESGVITPTLSSLKAQKTKQLDSAPESMTAKAIMPKVLTVPV